MSKHVEPAMSREEWAGVTDGTASGEIEVVWTTPWMETEYDEATGENRVANRGTEDHSLHLSPDKRPHALAALCLHGQPYGFTWLMVDAIRAMARFQPPPRSDDAAVTDEVANCPLCGREGHYPVGCPERPRLLHEAADRIQALLPPEEKG